MNKSKKLYILLGVLVVICAAAFVISKYEAHKEDIRNSDETILEIAGDSVTALSWEYEGETLSFHKDEKWLYDADEAFPVDEERLSSMLEQFEAFGASFVIENVEDYSQYGLDEPLCTIRLTAGEQSYEIKLGDYSKMDSQRYVSIGDGRAYLVSHDPLEEYDAVLSDMIEHDETPSFETVNSVRFEGGESYVIEREEESARSYCSSDIYFTGDKPLDTYRVDDYLAQISLLDPTNYVTYNATEDELASYGLDAPELTVTVDFSYEDDEENEVSDTFVLQISRNPEDAEKAREQDASDDTGEEGEEIPAYVRIGQSQIVYEISESSYEALMAASYNDLRHNEILSADFDGITQLDITLEGKNYTLTYEPDEEAGESEEDIGTWYYDGEEVEIASFRSKLTALTASEFTDEQPSQKEELSLTVHLDNENFPTVSIALYRYDGESCLALLDGQPVALVQRSAVVDLIEAINGFVL